MKHLLEISTDKVDSEVPSPAAGTLVEILAEENDTIEVGQPIAIISNRQTRAGSGSSAPKSDSGSSSAKERRKC